MRRAAFVAISTALVLACGPPAMAGPPRGQFVTHCEYSHSLPDDPIVHPDMPGMSHRHDFFGSTETDAAATVDRLIRGSSTCRLSTDTAAYWFPSAYQDGSVLVPTFAKAYYFGVPLREVAVPPLGLQLVAGDPEAASGGENPHATWSCGAERNHRTPVADHPYDCTPYAERWDFVDSVVARIQFPNCWDGEGLGPDAVAYAVDRRCPAGFRTRLPAFRTQVHYGILDPCGGGGGCGPDASGDAVTLRLSSGPYYTLHADFWNAWRPGVLSRLVARCLNAHRPAGPSAITRPRASSSVPDADGRAAATPAYTRGPMPKRFQIRPPGLKPTTKVGTFGPYRGRLGLAWVIAPLVAGILILLAGYLALFR